MAMRSRFRTQKIERRRSGIASTRGLNENTASPPRSRASVATDDEHDDQQEHVDQAGIVEEVEPDDPLDETDPDARTRERSGTSVNRAISAAVTARSSDPAPRLLRLPADPSMPPMRIIAMVATPLPSAQTNVEIAFGLTPRSRARSGLVAAALTARPSSVRLRNRPSPSAMSGTTTITDGERRLDPQIAEVPLGRERQRIARPGVLDIGEGEQDGRAELADADGRDEQDHPGRAEQSPHHREFDDRPVHDAHRPARGRGRSSTARRTGRRADTSRPEPTRPIEPRAKLITLLDR